MPRLSPTEIKREKGEQSAVGTMSVWHVYCWGRRVFGQIHGEEILELSLKEVDVCQANVFGGGGIPGRTEQGPWEWR